MSDALARWEPRLLEFLPDFLAAHPELAPEAGNAAALLHGSTTFGVDDAGSDLDVWLLLDPDALSRIDERAGTRFFEFNLEGKLGHCNTESRREMAERLSRCDMPWIAELRRARVLADPGKRAAALIERAASSMRDEVSAAWFQFHFVEMMGERKGGQNPAARGEAFPLLLFGLSAVAHALRAALVLDGEPYPYDKWLLARARETPTGAEIARLAATLLGELGTGALRDGPRGEEHPIRVALNDIRHTLRDAAEHAGIQGPWLREWWLHIHASREGIRSVEW
jgi:hypothetical protein